MGKLMDRLQKQLKTEYKKDAEGCIEIFNYLKEQAPGGHVWSSEWNPLVDTKFKGFPSDERTYSLNNIGRLVLKGLQKSKD